MDGDRQQTDIFLIVSFMPAFSTEEVWRHEEARVATQDFISPEN